LRPHEHRARVLADLRGASAAEAPGAGSARVLGGQGSLGGRVARGGRAAAHSRARPKIFDPGGTERVSQTLPPMTESAPITVSPPRIVAPAYRVTRSSMVGWRLTRFPALSQGARVVLRAPRVTP